MANFMQKKLHKVFWLLVEPKTAEKDLVRREFILNILLLGAIFLSVIALVSSTLTFLTEFFSGRGSLNFSPIIVFVIFLLFLFGYYLSRIGKFKIVAYALLGIYFLGATYTSYKWGVDVPESLLTNALLIIMSGILIGTRFSWITTGLISLILVIFTLLQSMQLMPIVSSWREQQPTLGDAIVYSATLCIIALVSWLFNREMDKALQRARRSEAALKRQRDHLEVMVTKRTRELQRVQSEKLLQLHRFAELGRLASGLFHDLVNPLNAVSLTLNRLQLENEKLHSEEEITRLVQRARLGAQQIETFITAARKQIQNQEILQTFSLKHEINQAIQILDYKAKSRQVRVLFNFSRDIRTFGNPIKFCQLITNIVSNGIEAYDSLEKKSKTVQIDLKRVKQAAVITIHDWGSGIKPSDISKVFDPLFTTKDFEKGTGIGLSLCKDTVEKHFHGIIDVDSDKKRGTIFTVTFPIKKIPEGKLLTETAF